MIAELLLLTALGAAPPAPPVPVHPLLPEPVSPAREPVEWNARNAEHLLNRAGFGARPAEISYAVRIGHEAFVEALLTGTGEHVEPFFFDPFEAPRQLYTPGMTDEQKSEIKSQFKRDDRGQLNRFASWWIGQMLDGPHPLQERMTLFWHGYFTSSYHEVRLGGPLIRQNELFRRHALGSFSDLLRDIVRDPAMVRYLSNDKNRKDAPNENLARELMELFTLGEGHYTEEDVKHAARALTGFDVRYGDEVTFRPGRHDRGHKTVLGVSGRHDADDLIDILLAQGQCPRWVSARLLRYFEGREPSAARVQTYASCLRANDYELQPFLRRLFLDPEFYADDVVGTRIAGPIDFLVGSTRRLGVQPPPGLLWLAAGQLGQRLFDPPNVKGWEGGEAWITTASMLQRGNQAGMLLGVVRLEDVVRAEPVEVAKGDGGSMMMEDSMMGSGRMMESAGEPAMEPTGKPASMAIAGDEKLKKKDIGADMMGMRRILAEFYWPDINFTARLARLGARSDGEVVDLLCSELLAVEVSPEGRRALLAFLVFEREALAQEGLELADGELLGGGPEVEYILRRLGHLILSLPEAQLV